MVITLDKVKLCLNKPGQCQNAPLRLLDESEIVEYLWTGGKLSIVNARIPALKYDILKSSLSVLLLDTLITWLP